MPKFYIVTDGEPFVCDAPNPTAAIEMFWRQQIELSPYLDDWGGPDVRPTYRIHEGRESECREYSAAPAWWRFSPPERRMLREWIRENQPPESHERFLEAVLAAEPFTLD